MFRLSSCLLLGGANAFTDETSLMQGLKPPIQDKQRQDKAAVSNLLESAKGMLKNGATSEVTDFVQEVLRQIGETLMPAMNESHWQEQILLDRDYAAIVEADRVFTHNLGLIAAKRAETEQICENHCDCRREESSKCSNKVHCDRDLHLHWRQCAAVENELWRIEHEIGLGDLPGAGPIRHADPNGEYPEDRLHFCEESNGHFIANGTTSEFRCKSARLMSEFMCHWPHVQHCFDSYNDCHHAVCEHEFTELEEKTEDCETQQANCENSNCENKYQIISARNEYTCSHSNALLTYDRIERETRLMMIDRQREFVSMKTVTCLLERILERNGRPCDETGEFENEAAACEREHLGLDFSQAEYNGTIYNLEIVFPCEMRQCGDGSEDHGPILNLNHGNGTSRSGCAGPLTCAVPQPLPPIPDDYCHEGEIFPGLPAIPEAPFFFNDAEDWNSHCNPRSECQTCYGLGHNECQRPVWDWNAERDSRRAYHVDEDGEERDGRWEGTYYPHEALEGSELGARHPWVELPHIPLHSCHYSENPVCCTAQTAECEACRQGLSLISFCQSNIGYHGCDTTAGLSHATMSSECGAGSLFSNPATGWDHFIAELMPSSCSAILPECGYSWETIMPHD